MPGLILAVEDELDLLTTIDYSLQQEGFETRTTTRGRQAIEMAGRDPVPNLILLDLMLPDISGLDVCRALRQNKRTEHIPIILVTAHGEEIDRVVGFEVGADDYVVKPFSLRELILRIKAVLRRVGEAPPGGDEIILFGRLRVDPAAHQAWVDDMKITLTALEFRLLTTLLSRKGRVQTRDMLLTDVWGFQADLTTRTVDTHVKRLREKLGAAAVYIETLRGVGYRFADRPVDGA